MDYRNYQKASEKHLSTCKTIMNSVILLNGNDQAIINQEQKLNSVLHNVYYLSGYTLECIINYAIFKHFKWSKPSIMDEDHSFSKRCGLSYGKLKQVNKQSTYPYIIHKHEFSRNIDILRKEFSTSKIPLIDVTEKLDSEVLKLFNSWRVEIRYHPPENKYSSIQLTTANIQKFVDTTDKVFNGVMKIIG